MNSNGVVDVLFLFLLAGLAEIGGGWLVWQWLRNAFGCPWGLLGGLILFLYDVIPTLQPEAPFGRVYAVYAVYGGIFIILSLLWGRAVDGWRPNRFDMIGAFITLISVAVILWDGADPE